MPLPPVRCPAGGELPWSSLPWAAMGAMDLQPWWLWDSVTILTRGESALWWLFLSTVAEYQFLLTFPLLVPKHCGVTKWDPSHD